MPMLGQLRTIVSVSRVSTRTRDPNALSHEDTFETVTDSTRCNMVEQLERGEDSPAGKLTSQEYLVQFLPDEDVRVNDLLDVLEGDNEGDTLRVLEVRKVRGSKQTRCSRVGDG